MRAVLVILIAALPGCATVIDEHSQSIAVETVDHKDPVTGAECRLSNDKGTWFVTTPGSTIVHKSYSDILVNCTKPGFLPASQGYKSAAGGSPWGNIILGGGIGWFVDHSTGAGFNYPASMTIEMTVDGEKVSNLLPANNAVPAK